MADAFPPSAVEVKVNAIAHRCRGSPAPITVTMQAEDGHVLTFDMPKAWAWISMSDRAIHLEIGSRDGYTVTEETPPRPDPAFNDFGAWRSIVGQLSETRLGGIGFREQFPMGPPIDMLFKPCDAFDAAGVEL